MQTALIVIHVIISLILIVVVLMQHGKQQAISGAIAGGAETFFGKNNGRTIDEVLKKVTAVVAFLFVASSIALAAVAISANKANDAAIDDSAAQIETYFDEEGNVVDKDGNILISAEDFANAQAEAGDEANQQAE